MTVQYDPAQATTEQMQQVIQDIGVVRPGEKVPVDGEIIEHQGKTYYFCSHDCHAKFMAEPRKYTS